MRVLINRSDAIGDSILTSGMAKMIKEKYPEAKVYFLISAKSSDVFKNHPYIDEVRIYHRNARFYLKIKEVLKVFSDFKPTHYFYVGGGYLPNFVSWLLRLPFRGGLKSRWHTYLFLNKGTRQKRSQVTMHEMEYNLNLLGPMGIDYHYLDKAKFSPDIQLTAEEKADGLNSFNEDLVAQNIETGKKIIFIHPGMTGHTLNWPPRNYGRLIIKLEQKFPEKFLFVVSYTPSDNLYLQGVKEILDKKENDFLKNRVYYFNGIKKGLRHY
ncbi:MAG: hypothetical protein K2Q18_03710, partial [Bdellovibrionales bacterium]|nr:hypothetical protein [Bdellovibrionales bacterium]